MTIAPLPTRPSLTHPRRLSSRPARRFTVDRQPIEDTTRLTVHLTVTLDGDDRYAQAVEVLDALRRVAAQLPAATVSLSGAPPSASLTDPARPAAAPAIPAPEASLSAEASPSVEGTADRVLVLVGSRSVRAAGRTIEFTRVEFDLLLFLAEHPRRVFTREQLLQSVWGFSHAGLRTVDVHIRRLRAKLGDAVVTTVRGVGYRLADGANLRVARPD